MPTRCGYLSFGVSDFDVWMSILAHGRFKSVMIFCRRRRNGSHYQDQENANTNTHIDFTASGFRCLPAVAARLLGLKKTRETSENTPVLKTLLERRPDTDLNKDGVLTWDEAQEARRKMQEARQKQEAARNAASRGGRGPAPTKADVPYGDHERHVLDFWQAESDKPTPLFIWIHGGGFRGGDKKSFPADLRSQCLKAGISCASIHYRLSGHAPYPAQMLDSARAVQFLRSKAAEWNLDPERFAAGGGSAGSGISQWLGYHEDLADANSDDPIARQSTRLSCVFPINMQSTYDPREIKRIIPGDAYKHPALVSFFGRPEGWDWDSDRVDDELDALLKDASPITHLTQGRRPHLPAPVRPGRHARQHPPPEVRRALERSGRQVGRRVCGQAGHRL